MELDEMLEFIVNNDPQFEPNAPKAWKDKYREDLKNLSDEELIEKFEWVVYLLGK